VFCLGWFLVVCVLVLGVVAVLGAFRVWRAGWCPGAGYSAWCSGGWLVVGGLRVKKCARWVCCCSLGRPGGLRVWLCSAPMRVVALCTFEVVVLELMILCTDRWVSGLACGGVAAVAVVIVVVFVFVLVGWAVLWMAGGCFGWLFWFGVVVVCW
jgi:hypothetical protein